ncbi:MAG: creatininase family protein, partial [Terriglobales bacterium]
MYKAFVTFAVVLIFTSMGWPEDKLSVHWEELTAADFRSAIEQSKGTCLLPFGILEKHGPHLPLGTDLLNVRYVAVRAAQQEYAIVFPEYYFGQIFEARHE